MTVYRRGREVRAYVVEAIPRAIITDDAMVGHPVVFTAGESVSWRKCIDRALKLLPGAQMVYGAKYSGEVVDAWPATVSDEALAHEARLAAMRAEHRHELGMKFG